MTGVLRTTVTMVDQPHVWLATTERHLQRGSHQWRIHMITHRPAHNLPRIQVQQHRAIQPSLLGPYVGDIATPHWALTQQSCVPADSVPPHTHDDYRWSVFLVAAGPPPRLPPASSTDAP